ncbi:transcriptional regulator [Bacillus cereus]|uniref:helix-turn-helix domain-containing protein n=1 Tax=Bacillus cereus group TaxID=86661 RepID=UPI0009771700|nr:MULTISPECIES: helix-turn-helix transcriptional regulator [Bacillus cereus group]ASK15867.1 transcriptional regulator [Bacillus cereus]MCC2439253.1 helix-turn-helix domain-containing protein [Bacillus paranthracis]MDG1606540.1 helix-turn-helix transcriptional regulator [Bacillus paranthracis]MDZ4432731.1 helix-turn-helix transcriptional regulator [Bacillus cereus]MDZ4510502.1 helix-turn-helix transcriptional regulator [Bacillus cereus]
MKIEEAFGLTLQKYRTDAKLSQEQLAFNSSLDRTYISLLERGKRRPTINTVFALAQTVNIKPSILMQDIENILTESNYS